jgi:adenylate cyclase
VDFAGDGVFVVYGAPASSEEGVHALEALRTAAEMRIRVRELAAALRQRGIPADLQIRVGINTGHCTVGVFGSDLMRAYKAVGFTVNIAARLQSEADPGSILCGFRTYALVEDHVRAVRREPLTVKGSTRPVEAWEVLDLMDRGEGEHRETDETALRSAESGP